MTWKQAIFNEAVLALTIAGLILVGGTFVKSGEILPDPGSKTIAIDFSPNGDCEKMVVDLLNGAKNTLDIAVYSLDNKNIVGALLSAKKRGISLKVLTDHTQAAVNFPSTETLAHSGIPFRLNSVDRIMHNKFGVADGSRVITGSFNWTESAQLHNSENCIYIDLPEAGKTYQDRFENVLWSENTQAGSDKHLIAMEAFRAKANGQRKRTNH